MQAGLDGRCLVCWRNLVRWVSVLVFFWGFAKCGLDFVSEVFCDGMLLKDVSESFVEAFLVSARCCPHALAVERQQT